MSRPAMLPHIHALLLLRGREATDNKEIAAVSGVSHRQVNKIFAGDADFTADQIRKLARFYSERGEQELSDAFHSPALKLLPITPGISNGIIDDEIADMVSILGHMKEAHAAGDGQAMPELLKQIEAVVGRLRAEAERL